MATEYLSDPMQQVFIFETSQQIEQMEQSVIRTESLGCYPAEIINEIFRIMHTIKSSAAMMLLNNISTLAHSTEDLFYFIREKRPEKIDVPTLSDILLEGIDFMKLEIEKIKNGDEADGRPDEIITKVKAHLEILKQTNNVATQKDEKEIKCAEQSEDKRDEKYIKKKSHKNEETESDQQFYISSDKTAKASELTSYKAFIKFQEDCGMENVRAYTIVHNLKEAVQELRHVPEDIINDESSIETISKEGFTIFMRTDKSCETIRAVLTQTAYIDSVEISKLESDEDFQESGKMKIGKELKVPLTVEACAEKDPQLTGCTNQVQDMINVRVDKLDKLMNLVGEMVITEAMVTQNPDLNGLVLDNFSKSARQLEKISGEIQDMVMSIRMLPIGPTFLKMNRVIRDMSKKLDKEVHLEIIGEDTEVDKNIIEHIGDPLLHLVRNAVDHGIESSQDRSSLGKPSAGTVTLEAKNAGSEVLIIIKDDGRGLNRQAILDKAIRNGITGRASEDMSDTEVFNLIFLPGFSTNESVTEFSGRGVGMDVVARNLENVNGTIAIESTEGKGTTITLKIPLTLAIIDGMNIKVGKSRYTLPIASIKESFRPVANEVFQDPKGNELIMIRGQCYQILRIHDFFNVRTDVTDLSEGIIIMLESSNNMVCVFADELLGEQQVVVKTLPKYIKDIKNIKGLAGCTLLGDGNISLILDVDGFMTESQRQSIC